MSEVAKRYCRALTETLRTGNGAAGSMDKYRDELKSVVDVITSDPRLKAALYSPVASKRDKAAILGEISQKLKVSPHLSSFLSLLARKERVGQLPAVLAVYDQVALEAEGGQVGEVVSAEPLDAKEIERLAQAFTKKLGHRVVLRVSVDPDLMAGIRVRVAGVTYDGTLKAQFGRMRERFMNASRSTTH